jgi:hypothetical protein
MSQSEVNEKETWIQTHFLGRYRKNVLCIKNENKQLLKLVIYTGVSAKTFEPNI